MKKYIPAPAMTFAQLRDELNTATPEQLEQPVRWWGEDRGGVINSIFGIDEDYGLTDEGYCPVSTIEVEEGDEPPTKVLPKGTLILSVDETVDEE